MAEPMRGTPILEGKAAKDFITHMKKSKRDPKKIAKLAQAMETHKKIVRLDAE